MHLYAAKPLAFLKYITVEPGLMVFFITHLMMELLNTNLYLQKACRLNATAEPDLDTPCDDEKAGILFVSKVSSDYRVVMMTLVLLNAIFATAWSDKAGKRRKPLMILSILGLTLQSAWSAWQAYNWTISPLVGALVDMMIQICSGTFLNILLITQVYICDISTVEDRTMRIGILTALKLVCMPIGYGSAGFLLRSIGFFYSFLLAIGLSVVSFVFIVLLVKDRCVPPDEKSSFWSVLSVSQITDNFSTVFKKSLGKKRVVVGMLLMIHGMVLFTTEGEKTVFYLFLRHTFKWDEKMYSMYLVYKLIGVIGGTVFCSVILSKVLKIHDGIIGVFAGFWDTLAALGYVFASQTWHLYAIPLLDIFHGAALSTSFSFLSKFYEGNEHGRLNSMLSIFGLFVPLCHPAYNIVFQKAIDFFPAMIFLISVPLDIIVCVFYFFCYYLTREVPVDVKA